MLKNHTLDALSVTATPTPVSGYPASNLLDPVRTRRVKVSGETAAITFQMNGLPEIKGLFLTGVGYPVGTVFELKGNSANSGWDTPDFTTGSQDAYPPSFPFGAGLFGQRGLGGYATTISDPYHRLVVAHYFASVVAHAWWRLEISAPTGTAEIALGVAGLCAVYELSRNFVEPWELEPVDTTELVETTWGDSMPGRKGTFYERMKLKFRNVPTWEMWDIQSALKTLGKTEFFIDAHPAAVTDSPFTRLYGRVAGYSGFKRTGQDRNDFDLIIQEQPGE